MDRKALEATFDTLFASPVTTATKYGRNHLIQYRPRHLLMARSIDRYLTGRREVIADIGCHDGFFLRLVSGMGFKRFLAVDYFELPPHQSYLTGLEGVEPIHSNFNEDAFLRMVPDGSVDCLVSTEVFEHLYHHPLGYLEECWRVLRTGGLLLLTTPNPCTFANAWRMIRGRAMSWGGVAFATTPKITASNEALATWDIHFREYAPSELQTIVNHLAGVEVLEQGFIGSQPAGGSFAKRMAKRLLSVTGLSNWRPVSLSQYMVLRKGAAG